MGARVRFRNKVSYRHATATDISAEARGKSIKPRDSRLQDDVASLLALAASASVPVTRVATGARTVSEKQAHLALHATDEYRFAARHFVGEIEARLGVRNPTPVEPRPQVEMTDEEAEAERKVKLRRYWARKRRGAP